MVFLWSSSGNANGMTSPGHFLSQTAAENVKDGKELLQTVASRPHIDYIICFWPLLGEASFPVLGCGAFSHTQ